MGKNGLSLLVHGHDEHSVPETDNFHRAFNKRPVRFEQSPVKKRGLPGIALREFHRPVKAVCGGVEFYNDF